MRLYRDILSIGLLIAALAWTLWFVFAGFGNHQDPLYWLYKYEHLQGGWMATGTLLAGGGIVHLFGAQLLPLRLAGWLCTVLAIALPYGCLLNKEQRRENWHWLAIAYLLMGYGAFQEYSPGTLTVLLLSAIWVSATKSQITNYKSQILTAILAGIAVSVRFPNILVLLVLIPLWKKRSLWNIPIATATAGIIYLLGYWFITPAPLDAAMTSHELMSMLSKLWTSGGMLVGYMLLAAGVLAIWRKRISGLGVRGLVISGIGVGLLIVYFLVMTTKATQWYNADLTYFLSALALVLAVANQTSYIKHHTLYIGAAILIVATLGTDTAWLKLFPAVLCLLPVAGVQMEEKMRKYVWWVLVPVTVLVMVRHSTNSVGKTNLTKVETMSAIAPYQGIAITNAEEARLAQIKVDYDSIRGLEDERLRGLEVIAVGQNNHLMRAVTGCEAARYNEFWSNIFDSVYTDKYRPIIEAERPIVFCYFSPQFKTKPTRKDRQSTFENMLREEEYRSLDRSEYNYMIYIPD